MTEPGSIKRCPHCGGTAALIARKSHGARCWFTFVKCDICGAAGKAYNTPTDPAAEFWSAVACGEAVAAWNMRTNTEGNE